MMIIVVLLFRSSWASPKMLLVFIGFLFLHSATNCKQVLRRIREPPTPHSVVDWRSSEIILRILDIHVRTICSKLSWGQLYSIYVGGGDEHDNKSESKRKAGAWAPGISHRACLAIACKMTYLTNLNLIDRSNVEARVTRQYYYLSFIMLSSQPLSAFTFLSLSWIKRFHSYRKDKVAGLNSVCMRKFM